MSSSKLRCATRSFGILTLLWAIPAHAAELAYGGRLVEASGAPLAGPVDITVRFYGSATGSDQRGPAKTFTDVPLSGGLFQLTVSLEAADEAAILGDGTAAVFVEIEASGKVYPRQRYTHVPLALRIPVDNDSLVYDADAKLTVGEIAIGQVQGLQAALAQKLDSTPASSAASGYLSSADWTTFAAKQDAITASSSLTTGSLTTAEQDAVVIKPYGAQAGETGELRFEERTGGNYVAFKAPDSLPANKVWTLPAADGAAGAVLATDGSGGLSWAELSGANILDATIGDAKLQTITAPGKVSGAAITSGTIGGSAAFAGSGGVTTSGNITLSPAGSAATELRFQGDDASHYVAFKAPSTIAADKVFTLPAADGAAGQFLKTDGSGVLSWDSPSGAGDMLKSANLSDVASISDARSNLGLGALATLSSVGSSEIVDGSIVDADIAGAAAIATSKLSGAVTSITGHGLGSLATLSSVTAAEIGDGEIADADISASAAIATSKLSGPLTAISGHGLGSLAALSVVGTSEITDGTIVDADISASAAIADTKLATLSTPGKVAGGAITSGTIGGTATFGGSGGVSTSGSIAGSGNFLVSGTGAAATELRFGDDDNSNYVGLKAPASVTTNKVWTLPAADGTSGDLLKTDGTGGLSWVSGAAPTGAAGGDLTGNYPNPALGNSGVTAGTYPKVTVDAKGRVTSGSSTITSSDIDDGTIANVDIAGAAAIATSKLSGSVTSIASHGLGALATLSAVGSAQITDDTIANADISSTAAIATSKLSGALTAVSGHGLGALASLSAVSATEITDGTIANADIAATAAIDASKIASGSVSSAEFQYLDGLTSSIQTQLDAKASATSPTFIGAISSALGTAAAPSYSFTGDANTGVWSSGADTVNVSTGGSERLRVTSTGNVGIGTTSPAYRLHVKHSADKNLVMESMSTGMKLVSINDAGSEQPITVQGSTASLMTSGTDRLFVTVGGNVGIGTTAPDRRLEIQENSAGALTFPLKVSNNGGPSSSSAVLFTIDAGSARGKGALAYKGNGTGWNRGDFMFLQNSVGDSTTPSTTDAVMTIANGGNVGIGTTAPQTLLDVNGEIGSVGVNKGFRVSSTSGDNINSAPWWGLGYNSLGHTQVAGSDGIDFVTGAMGLNVGADQVIMSVSDTVAVKVDMSVAGNVGVGTSSPSATLDVNGDIKTSGAVSYGSLKDFRMVYRDDFQSAATGWSMTTRSACGDATILGGYNVTAGTSFYRDFDLTGIAHTEVMVRFTLYLMDTWDGETVYSQVGGIGVFSRTHSANLTGTTEICGLAGYTEMALPVEGRISHSGNTLRVLVGSTLNEAANNESFGVDNVEVWVR